MQQMCKMDPIYYCRPKSDEVAFARVMFAALLPKSSWRKPPMSGSGVSLDEMPDPKLHRFFGLSETGPVLIYTSRTKRAALIANLGNFVRGRKTSAPSAYADMVDYSTEDTVLLVRWSNRRSIRKPPLLMREAPEISATAR